MLLYLFLLLSHILGLTAGDTISPDQDHLTGTEGKSVTMKCYYKTDYSFPQLYWYKHDSDLQAPQFILWKGAKSYSHNELIPDKWYESRTTDTSTELTIRKLNLANTALYYCAVSTYGTLTFGNPIKLTVVPADSSVVPPTLFILRPQLRPNSQEMPTSSEFPEVCLALDFHPKGGHMKLNDDRPLSTGNAPVSVKSKTYFFAGISSEPINTCDLNGVNIKAKSDSDNKDVKAVPTSPPHKVEPKVTSRKPDIPVAPAVVPTEDVYPKRSKLNLYTLVMNGVRVLLTKALAFSTILTVKALVF